MMCIHKRLPLVILIVLAIGLLQPAYLTLAQSGYTVDLFDTAQSLTQTGVGSTSSTADDTDSDILGDERDLEVTVTSGSNDLAVTVNQAGNSLLSHSQDSDIYGWTRITWDGNDNDATTLNATGLGGVDLTQSGTKTGFHLRVNFCDLGVTITLSVYTDASNWSTYDLVIPGLVTSPRSFFVPFGDFSVGGGSGATFSNVGAVVMYIDGTSTGGLDLNIDYLETASFDLGDLPASYNNTKLEDEGARHYIGTLYLGSLVDSEAEGQESANADGDDNAGNDDEDGVQRDMTDYWTNNAVVDLTVTVTGCSGTCYLNGWIDWGGDNSFSGDQVFSDKPVVNGSNALTITVPGADTYTVGDDVYARFRLCTASGSPPSGCNSTTGQVNNGEVEDYFWQFGPNAVTLNELEARSVGHNWPLIPAAIGLATIGGVGLFALVQRRKGSASR